MGRACFLHSHAHAGFFFLTEAKIPDRIATCNSGAVQYVGHACLFFLTAAEIPDTVATHNSGA